MFNNIDMMNEKSYQVVSYIFISIKYVPFYIASKRLTENYIQNLIKRVILFSLAEWNQKITEWSVVLATFIPLYLYVLYIHSIV